MTLDPRQQRMDRVVVNGVELHAVTERHCVQEIVTALQSGRGGWVATHNLDHLRRLETDGEFARLCGTASLRVADGAPVVWASRLSGRRLPERVAGSALIWSLSAAAARYRRSIFFLGGDPGTAEACAETLSRRFPELRVAGCFCPQIGFERDPDQSEAMRRMLVNSKADIVFIALGSPKQERLIVQLVNTLPRAWFLGVGISFSFVAGAVKRAPRWMQMAGLEWLHRLLQEPGRLFKRYLVQGVPFAVRVLMRTAAGKGNQIDDPLGSADDADDLDALRTGPRH